jgi:photosystem II stability/assembly factor-like uncharacterized protein
MAAHLPPLVVFSDDFEQDRSLLMASMEGTIVRSTDGGATWDVVPAKVEASPGDLWGTVSLLAGKGSGTFMTLLAAAEAELALSRDSGASWTVLTGIFDQPLSALAISSASESDETLMVGTAGGQVLLSSDGGHSWEPRGLFEGESVIAIAASNQYLYAVTAQQTDAGTWRLTLRQNGWVEGSWRELFSREAGQPAAVLTASDGQDVYCAMEQRVMCVSGTELRTESELQDSEQISSLAILPEGILAGSRTGLYHSVDGGQAWEHVSSDISVVALHAVSSGQVYAVSMGGGLWKVATT